MGIRSGNPTWQDHPDTTTPITAARLNNIETALDAVGGGSPKAVLHAPGSAFLPRFSQAKLGSGDRLASHWNVAAVASASALRFVQRSGSASNIYRFVIYKVSGTNTLELVYTTPEFSSVGSGEETIQVSATNFSVPEGLLFIGFLMVSGSDNVFNTGGVSGFGQVRRDVNIEGGVVVNFTGIGPGWVPPSSITVTDRLSPPGVPQVEMVNGVLA